jgi:hypothetical protein
MRIVSAMIGGALLVSGAVLSSVLSNAVSAGELDSNAAAFLQNLSLPMPNTGGVIFCHGFGCVFRTQIGLGSGDRARMSQLMAAGRRSAEAERKAIALTEVWFEKRVAPETGTAKAKARSGGMMIGGDPTQFDCIDATANTTTLLVVLDQLGLLKYHQIDSPISRLFTGGGPHFTAVIKDKKSGQGWTVDPWTHDHGELPDVWPVERWKAGG